MEIKLSHYEFGLIVVAILKDRVVPGKFGLYDVALTDGACVVKGEYDLGTGIRWSLRVWVKVSDDGKQIGLTFGKPDWDSTICSWLAPSREEMQAKLLSAIANKLADSDDMKLKGDTLWVSLDFVGCKLGLGCGHISNPKLSIRRDSFDFLC